MATLGPASSDPEVLRSLVRAGMNMARINTSHAGQDEIAMQIEQLRKVAAEENSIVGVMLDLAGPKIRVDNVSEGGYLLTPGDELTLGTDADADLRVRPQVGFKAVDDQAQVMLDDGRISLNVLERNRCCGSGSFLAAP